MENKQNGIIIGIVFGVVLLMLIGAGAFYFTTVARDQANVNSNTNGATNTAAAVNEPSVTTTQDAVNKEAVALENTTGERIVDSGVTWLAKPEELDSPSLFTENTDSDYRYYKVADLEDGGEIITAIGQSMGGYTLRLKKDVNGRYSLIAKNSDTSTPENLKSSVLVDSKTELPSLYYPATLLVNGLLLKQDAGSYNTWFDVSFDVNISTLAHPATGTIEEFGETKYGTLYVSVTPLETASKGLALYTKKYLLVLSDTSVITYTVDEGFLVDDGTFSDALGGTLTTAGEPFRDRGFVRGIIADGCGGTTGVQFPAEVDVNDLTVIGTTPKGEPLYTPKDGNEALLRVAYDVYLVGRDYPGATETPLSFEAFAAAKPLVMWKDKVGDFLIYRDPTFGPMAECGKPVIYLYPTQTTPVSVRVDADVTVSEPAYGKGWNVVAQPDGTLTTVVGEVVRSLYWEGKGHGEYPAIAVGNVVATKDVEQRIRTDLTTMGLNAVETQDFLDFWMPRMPNTPYVRLTWFDTAQMNRLAPLAITPRPQTVLRVFLDFRGQATAETQLAPQTVRRTERRGFTVVEWGGLLLGGR